MRKAKPVMLTETMRSELLKLKRGAKTPQRLVQRSSIVLLAEAGMANDEIGARLGLTPHKVARWRNRYVEKGLTASSTIGPVVGARPRSSRNRKQSWCA